MRQIAAAVGRMRRYVGDRSLAEFLADEMAVDAVVRTLEIVSEASRRLSSGLKEKYPAVPWTLIAGAGNVYRHDYEDVLAERIYNTATIEIQSLVEALTEEGLF
jgi:uncharacterized protein with HEPN domain